MNEDFVGATQVVPDDVLKVLGHSRASGEIGM
jgi:hypothetical protein